MPIGAVLERRLPPIDAQSTAEGSMLGGRSTTQPCPGVEISEFAQLFGKIRVQVAQGEATLRNALNASHAGRDMGPEELIAIQAGVYRYSETVDLVAKLVDHATTGIKTVVQAQ